MEAAQRFIRGMNGFLNTVVALALALVMLYSGYALWDTFQVYNRASLPDEIMHFKPVAKDASNPTLSELLAINPDVCAWLTVDGTNIDYPVLQGADNSTYLNRDIYGSYSLGGSIFLDCRNDKEYSDAYSLLYGHHMNGGAMFGDIEKFEDAAYFKEHQTAWLFVPGKTYKLTIYAYLHEDAYASEMFNIIKASTGAEYKARIAYIAGAAVHYQDIGVTADDRIIALSTCSSASTNGRSILVARMVEYTDAGGEKEAI